MQEEEVRAPGGRVTCQGPRDKGVRSGSGEAQEQKDAFPPGVPRPAPLALPRQGALTPDPVAHSHRPEVLQVSASERGLALSALVARGAWP